MKKLIILFLFQLPIMLLGQLPSNDKNWSSTPKFKEDFSETRSWQNTRIDNTNTWRAYFSECGIIHSVNDERQIYQRENALFNTPSSGYLTLRAEYKPNTTNYWFPYYAPATGSWDYISGAIETIKTFKYGYFEIRCSLPPANKGNFPAFWLWGNSPTGRYNEIDIFEHVIDTNAIADKTFTGGYFSSTGILINKAFYVLSESESSLTNFHTYAIEWSPSVIIWYFDGKQIGAVLNDPDITNEAMPIKINYALNTYVNQADKTRFPLDMVIDYVNVYQLNCGCDETVVITNATELSEYAHSVKKKIGISGTTQTITVPQTGITLRATEEITISGGFEVPIGSEFYATTHACPN